jgi:hypothetical protein
MSRQRRIARSIVRAVLDGCGVERRGKSVVGLILALFSSLFALFQLHLRKVRPADFANLRRNYWDISDDSYASSFDPAERPADAATPLKPIGDMGFSGSVSSLFRHGQLLCGRR